MVLFLDACVREDSRTRELAKVLLPRLSDEVETRKLFEEELPTMTEALLTERAAASAAGDVSAPCLRNARQFAAADTIVIAAPYWDLSFPAQLKRYLESVCVTGVTFRYGEDGRPIGLCRAKKLYYVTTAGGPIFNREFGFGYVSTLAAAMFGIPDCRFFSAENLDIIGNDVEAILQESKAALLAAEL